MRKPSAMVPSNHAACAAPSPRSSLTKCVAPTMAGPHDREVVERREDEQPEEQPVPGSRGEAARASANSEARGPGRRGRGEHPGGAAGGGSTRADRVTALTRNVAPSSASTVTRTGR